MRRRVSDARVARLATVDAQNRPHLVPCTFALDGETFYSVIDEVKAKTTRDLRRLANIRVHPDVTVLVDHYDEDWSALWWIRLDGVAEILDGRSPQHEAGTRALAAKYPQYADVPLDGPLIVMHIARWQAWP